MSHHAPPSTRLANTRLTIRSLALILLFSAIPSGHAICQDSDSGKAAKVDSRVAADLLPASVVAYAEVPRLGDVIKVVMEHPLRQSIQSMPVVQLTLESDGAKPLRDGMAAFEGSMGRPWNEAIAVLTDGGIHVAFDASTEGAALLIKSSDRDQLERFRNATLAIIQLAQGDFGIVDQAVYRGFTAYAVGNNLKMALVDHWFIVTNKSELGKSIIDRYLDGGKDSLANSENFKTIARSAGDASLKAFFDLQTLRQAGVAPKAYSGKTDNIAAEALLGGIVSNLQHAPSALAVLDLERSTAKLSLATEHKVQWGQGREYFFGENGDASAPPLLDVPERLLAISTYRDLSQMWLRAPDLMSDKANEELAKADTGLTTFFSGRDFGEDILGSLQPGIQLLVQRQSFDPELPQPAIKLPSFAMQFRMRTPEVTTKEFRRVFQNVIGFINVVGAMQGQPQLDLGFEQSDSATLITATYIPPRDEQDVAAAAINYNFSPTIAFAGDRMVISSTSQLAQTISAMNDESESKADHPNTHAVIQFDALAATLSDNRSQLVAQNMLEKGHGPDQAEAEIGMLFDVLEMFENVSMDLDVVEEQLKLSLQVKVKSESIATER